VTNLNGPFGDFKHPDKAAPRKSGAAFFNKPYFLIFMPTGVPKPK